ncbi:hypothetical protein A6A06_27590 [Streptomyces sp. CB02923]|uniref:hypothetical protein n=1 Tax=Streptomyces sp. CB02923 TaxID=1718985 RepID=UPI00093C11D3|nr:hypothetical protein [Streptomyces sp. CB02923]OKH99304.1 hypothetical protein A6A06_27590 [Streptomyces sp. CB02923]
MQKTGMRRAAAALVAVAAIAGASPAFALRAATDGARAETFSHNKKIRVLDTKRDGKKVKAEYYRAASPGTKRTLWNDKGKGHWTKSGSGSRIFRIHVCKEINHAPDKCSAWRP